jgi:pimeloyl-ACP methyl ester carboxylesterase
MTVLDNTPQISQEAVDLWGGRLTMRVNVAGAGAALLYLHPAGGLAWDPFLSRLATRYTVYAPELPGTSAGDPYAIHAVDELSDLVLVYEELVRRLGLAAELAALNPGITDKLVLLDPLGLWREDTPIANPIAAAPHELPGMLFHDPAGAAARAFLEPPADPDAAAAATAAMVWALGCAGKFLWPVFDRGLRNRGHRITAATLIVWGEQDALIPAAYAAEFQALIPDSQVVLVPECGHIPHVEQLEHTSAAVSEFLSARGAT